MVNRLFFFLPLFLFIAGVVPGVIAISCISDIQCPGGGTYVADFNDPDRKTSVLWECLSNECTLIESVTSECVTTAACLQGKTCNLDTSTGMGVCVGFAGTDLPPEDVETALSFFELLLRYWWVIALFIGLIAIIVVVVVVMQ